MLKRKGILISSFAQARNLRAAARLNEVVTKPAILTLRELKDGLESLRSNRKVYVQLCGASNELCLLGTVGQLRDESKDFHYPSPTPIYVLCGDKIQTLNAWPIIWQGAVEERHVLAAYVDPVRYGFKSRAETLLTIGPPTPMPIESRRNGFWINRDQKTAMVRFDPMTAGDDGVKRTCLETVSARKLTSRFGRHWHEVLQSYLDAAPRKKGQQQQYNVFKALPDKAEYENLLRQFYTRSVDEIVEDAYQTLEDLGNEMQEAFDNMPDSLKYTDVGTAREDAASNALSIAENKPTVPNVLAGLEVYRLPSGGSSRGARASDAREALQAVIEAAETQPKKVQKECKGFLAQLDEDAFAIEDIEFPGMFG